MKRKTVFVIAFLCSLSVVLSSYYTGVGISYQVDCTGAETAIGQPTGCSITGACHAHTPHQTWLNVGLELDSAGVPVTHYSGGQTYTVRLFGSNPGNNDTLPRFGFQITCIAGAASSAGEVNAGTWSPIPAHTHYCPPQPGYFYIGLLEQNPPDTVTTGTGTAGSTYEKDFSWIAPVSGTGVVSFWAAMNAINNDGQYTGDNYNNASMIINEWPQAVGISEVHAANFNFSFGPNPANGAISINYILQQQTNVTIDIYDTNGKLLMPLHTANEPAGVHSLTADVSALSRGVYIITMNTEMGHTSKRLVVAE